MSISRNAKKEKKTYPARGLTAIPLLITLEKRYPQNVVKYIQLVVVFTNKDEFGVEEVRKLVDHIYKQFVKLYKRVPSKGDKDKSKAYW